MRNQPLSGAQTPDQICQEVSESDKTYFVNQGITEFLRAAEGLNLAGLTTQQTTRFLSKVQQGSGCWPWTAGRFAKGYGMFNLGRVDGKQRTRYAHRLMWALTHGEIPAGMEVCHHCDNPPCCNPAHLFIGTHTDNMRDASRKGRKSGPRRRRVYSLEVIEQGLNCKRGELVHLARRHGFDLRAFSNTVRRERIRRQRSLPGKAA